MPLDGITGDESGEDRGEADEEDDEEEDRISATALAGFLMASLDSSTSTGIPDGSMVCLLLDLEIALGLAPDRPDLKLGSDPVLLSWNKGWAEGFLHESVGENEGE